jgi:single-stranded-DNA-specific exonuclease
VAERTWIDPPEVDVSPDLAEAVGGHPLVGRILVRRGLSDPAQVRAFVDPECYTPAPPWDLPNMAAAVARVERAVDAGERICVWGDFDVDGQTATTLLVSTLRDLGAVVEYHIPDREKESHGVHLAPLKRLIADGVDLVLTCDTGITAHRAITYAQAHGVDVVVTDHHDLPPTLPPAHALLNPKMLAADHPLSELPGVGCAYKLAQALYERVGRPEEVERHLDLVALGIVADVAVQTGDTRYLLQRGLERLRRTRRLGLRELMAVAELTPDLITEEDVGFGLAPRLNALGRLDDATVAVELLTTDDLSRARVLASMLEGLNARRKLLCDQVTQAAEAQIEADPALLDYGALVLEDASWPGGVLGIVAGRLAARYNRPAILFAAPPDEIARGSARSVEGCHITEAIAAHQDLVVRFGGHPMAAGLTIEPEKIPLFRRALSETVLEMLGEIEERPPLEIDGYLALEELTLDLVEDLDRLAPFGVGNPRPTLATRALQLVSHRTLGQAERHLRLWVRDEDGRVRDVVWWRGAGRPLPEGPFDLAYALQINTYRGQREVQVVWVDARPVEAPVRLAEPAAPDVEVIDYRREPRPRRLLDRLRAQQPLQVWAEASHRSEVDGRDRRELVPGERLAIWTLPPGPEELRAALEATSPRTVIVFAGDPGMDDPQAFLERLAGLVKRAVRTAGGRIDVLTLAAATAQRRASVEEGLAWLVARGHVAVVEREGELIRVARGGRGDGAALARAAARLTELLEETAAYRAFFARAEDLEQLIRACAPQAQVG